MNTKSHGESWPIIAEFTDRAIPLKNNPKPKRPKPSAKKEAKPENGPAKRGSRKTRRGRKGDKSGESAE